MLKIGLTGGIGSGKTAVSNSFTALGAPVIDADKIARDLVEPGKPAYQAIVKKFGVSFLKKSGQLNRPKLRQRVFAHPNERLWLEALLHPLIREETIRRVTALKTSYCLIVVPLLIETYTQSLAKEIIDRILVIDIPLDVQIKRVMMRDKISEDEAKAIINTQVNRQERLQWADDVIENKGSLVQLRDQVAALHEKYLKLASSFHT